jgi:hypothetical protein
MVIAAEGQCLSHEKQPMHVSAAAKKGNRRKPEMLFAMIRSNAPAGHTSTHMAQARQISLLNRGVGFTLLFFINPLFFF